MMDGRSEALEMRQPPRSARPRPDALADSVLEELWFGDEDPERPRSVASQSLAATVARIEGLRPFPVAAQKLMQILSRADYQMSEVRAVLETDPSLAARTFTVANSPLFRGATPCKSLEQSVVRLGARNVRDLAMGVATMSMFADAAGQGRRSRDHCVGTAAIARVLADAAMPNEASTLFLAGLMHDVGKLLLLQTGEMTYPADDEDAHDDEAHLLERARLGFDHAVLGGHVMRLWRFPDPTETIVAWHHQPARALAAGGEIGLMVALLRAADQLDHELERRDTLDAETARRLGQDASWTYADFSQGDLRELWPRLCDARRETLGALAK